MKSQEKPFTKAGEFMGTIVPDFLRIDSKKRGSRRAFVRNNRTFLLTISDAVEISQKKGIKSPNDLTELGKNKLAYEISVVYERRGRN